MSDDDSECIPTATLFSASLSLEAVAAVSSSVCIAGVPSSSSPSPPLPLPSQNGCNAPRLLLLRGGGSEADGTAASSSSSLATRTLKRHLKQRSRIRKYEMQWLQACTRNDEAIQQRAIHDLQNYLIHLQSIPDSLWYHPPQSSSSLSSSSSSSLPLSLAYHDFVQDACARTIPIQHDIEESPSLIQARLWITKKIWQKLVNRMLPETMPPHSRSTTNNSNDITTSSNSSGSKDDNHRSLSSSSSSGRSKKLIQTLQARPLLSHMTRGTQTESMFDNDAALIGYTRQKFMERAVLTFKSLERLLLVDGGWRSVTPPPAQDSPPSPLRLPPPPPSWEQLLQQVRSVLSIGCGPGCDAVGVLTFLQHMGRERGRGEGGGVATRVDRVVLMDFVMPQWKRLVIDHLESILCPMFGITVETASCDVRYSLLHDERNSRAATCICEGPPIDLVVVSYLLTETRDQWEPFFLDLLNSLTQSCLLLLSEPTAWQLHSFTSRFADYIEGQAWVDSSQPFPDLQALEGRMGPAVLVLHVRPKASR